MSLTYVIPDIHGRYDLLRDALAAITAYSGGEAGTIVTIGDYVDKGPASRGVIDQLMFGPGDGFALVTLKGNHDAMMTGALRDHSKMADWLDRLQLFRTDAHRLYVHAGVEDGTPLDQQREETLLWKRYPKGFPGGYGNFHVVHGHDNCPDGPLLYEGRTNLDTLAWKTGRLTIGIFDDDRAGGPVDFIIIKGEPARR